MTRLPFALLALALGPLTLPAQQTSFAVVPFESQQSFGLDQESLGALGGGIAQLLASELGKSPGGTATARSTTAGAIIKGISNEDPKMQDRDQIYLITQAVAQRILQELKLPPAPASTAVIPGAAVIAFSLGLQAEDAGNKAKATSLYERALQSAPDFPEAKDALARVKG